MESELKIILKMKKDPFEEYGLLLIKAIGLSAVLSLIIIFIAEVALLILVILYKP